MFFHFVGEVWTFFLSLILKILKREREKKRKKEKKKKKKIEEYKKNEFYPIKVLLEKKEREKKKIP